MKAPSGVKARATTGFSIVMEYLGRLSGLRTFQRKMAPSSPPEARSLSSSGGYACNGCHWREVITPMWALIGLLWPDWSQSCVSSLVSSDSLPIQEQ
jgi:hypothetical protein